jgi:hypothetical protein
MTAVLFDIPTEYDHERRSHRSRQARRIHYHSNLEKTIAHLEPDFGPLTVVDATPPAARHGYKEPAREDRRQQQPLANQPKGDSEAGLVPTWAFELVFALF